MKRSLFVLAILLATMALCVVPALATTPDTATWSSAGPPIYDSIRSLDFTASGNGCVASSSTGYYTPDGQQWIQQNALAGLLAIDYVDDTHAWAVGDMGRIAATSDGGATWSEQTSGVDWRLVDVSFLDTTTGWALGQDGRTLRTGDGGVTWETAGSCGSGTTYVTLQFVDELHGWAGSSGAGLWATVDGGDTWQRQGDSFIDARFIVFSDKDSGWAASPDATWHTSDGGASWTQTAPVPYPSTVALAGSGATLWRFDQSGVPSISPDGGATWHTQSTASYASWSTTGILCIAGDEGWFSNGWSLLHTSTTGYSDPEPPVTTAVPELPRWLNSPTTVTLTATDAGSGVDVTYYSLKPYWDQSYTWVPGLSFYLAANTDYRVAYTSTDLYGNIEQPHVQNVGVDAVLPTTQLRGAGKYDIGYWINHKSTIYVSGNDNLSGVDYVRARIDSKAWQNLGSGSSLVIAAPKTHSNDGKHTVTAHAVDNAANAGVNKSASTWIDTRRPVSKLPYPVSGPSRGYTTMKFRVNDVRPCAPKCMIEIRVKYGSTLVGQLLPGKWFYKNKLQSYRFYCPLPAGKYTILLRAADGAGNISPWKYGTYTLRRAGVAPERAEAAGVWQVGGLPLTTPFPAE